MRFSTPWSCFEFLASYSVTRTHLADFSAVRKAFETLDRGTDALIFAQKSGVLESIEKVKSSKVSGEIIEL